MINRRHLLFGISAIGIAGVSIFWEKILPRLNFMEVKGWPNTDRPAPTPINEHSDFEELAKNCVLFQFKPWLGPIINGQGVFINNDTILTAAHIAHLFSQKNNRMRIFHANTIGPPIHTLIPETVYEFSGYNDRVRRPETDIAIIKLKFPRTKNDIIPVKASLHALHSTLRLISFWGPGWAGKIEFKKQYESVGIRLDDRVSSNQNFFSAHDAPTRSMWSGSPVYGTINGTAQLIGIHVAEKYKIANFFCGFSNSLLQDFKRAIHGETLDTARWRTIWTSPTS